MSRQFPASFQVRDDFGRIWPPGFESQLCDPCSANSMLSDARTTATAAAARLGRETAMANGTGWGNGTIESLAKPHIQPRPPQMMSGGNPPQRQRAFAFRVNSPAARAYGHLLKSRGAKVPDRELADMLKMRPTDLRAVLAPAVSAGLLRREAAPKRLGKYLYWAPEQTTVGGPSS